MKIMIDSMTLNWLAEATSSRLLSGRRRIGSFSMLLVGLLAGVVSLSAQPGPRRPTPRQATRPNILFAIADDWSFGHAGAYG
ncbi:MAG: hypothetical protein ACKOB4_11100, partial [Acidobacteriota bacterium]